MEEPIKTEGAWQDNPSTRKPSRSLFSTTYTEARAHVLSITEDASLGYHSGEARTKEKLLYSIWAGQHIKRHGLRTTDGREIRILSPGWWSPGSGPDFSRAEILFPEGPSMSGDVEVHLQSSDWEAHGHNTDRAYNSVILHVVLRADKQRQSPLRQDGKLVPELELINYLDRPLTEFPDGLEGEGCFSHSFEPGRCSATLANWPAEKIGALLDMGGDERVLLKTRRMEQEALLHGYQQATYAGIMEALGYSPNRRPFGALARLLPEGLLRESVVHIPGHAGQTVLEAVFFGVGNLFPDHLSSQASDAETDHYLKDALEVWKNAGERINAEIMDREEWDLKGIRPPNHPLRRLSGMAHLMMRHKAEGIFDTILGHLNRAWDDACCREGAQAMISLLTVPAVGYWACRHDFGAKTFKGPMSLIGKERAAIAIINTVIPVLLIYARHEGEEDIERKLHYLYSAMPPSTLNRVLRFMAARLFGLKTSPPHLEVNARRQQGLIQLYHDFCAAHQEGCSNCIFPQLLERLQC